MKRHIHDCEACKFLGNYKEYDLYHCANQILGGDVIARYGSNGVEYTSESVNVLIRQGIFELAMGLNEMKGGIISHIGPREGEPLMVGLARLMERGTVKELP